jgi:hypothetical protein
MFFRKGAAAVLAASIRGALIGAVEKLNARSHLKGGIALERATRAVLAPRPVMPLFGWGQESKGPHRRHPMWPRNHYSTTWHPSARHGEQECARRRRQIARGQLTKANGLTV